MTRTSRRPPLARAPHAGGRPLAAVLPALAVLAALAIAGCGRPVTHVLMDAFLADAHRPPAPVPAHTRPELSSASPYRLLAGDLHCHILPPDGYPHVSRRLPETVALARAERLDFVVLTPHLRARFFLDEARRAHALEELDLLERDLAREARGGPLFISGFEYTDFTWGHVGAAFADLREVLAAVPVAEAREHPGRFFEEYVRRGGVLTLNHPVLVPLDSVFPWANRDMSWAPFFQPAPWPDEIRAAHRLAQGLEVFNLAVSELRDSYLLSDRHHSTRAALAVLDREIAARPRRFSPIGGSDSHSDHLRATTFVLARERSLAGIREALLAGRVCVRDPAACTLEVREARGAWQPVGSALSGAARVHARARGRRVRLLVNGREVAPGPDGEAEIALHPGRCAVIRAEVDEGFSGPVYVNCGL